MLEHESIQASSDETPAEEPHLARSAHCGCTCPDQTDGIESMPEEELLYDLADLFKVFSDTTRIKILYALLIDELSVNEIAEAIGASQSAISHQLRILKQAHLVKFRRDGRSICYSLADGHVQTILDQGLSHVCE
ncbi:ArsR/SmtB family transcription factor [Slackia piriformis]|uniref:ArsR/SmtB family transcription factor n=1 Tax=Slackia piriformis TaxID=626934 RepID=UPI00387E8DCF